jgi:murein DD-endopeptidase MepM/ murein hydrolase activator NlpD
VIVQKLTVVVLILGLVFGAAVRAQHPSPVVVMDPYAETARLETELTTARATLAEAEGRHARSATELEQLAPRQQHAKQGMRARVRALYRMQRAGHLPVAGGFHAMLTHLARVERLERIVARDVRSVTYLDRRTAAIRDEVREAASTLEAARAQVVSLEARKAAIDTELEAQAVDPWLAAIGAVMPPGQAPGIGHLGVAPLPAMAPLAPTSYGAAAQPIEAVSGFALMRGRLGAPVARALEVRDAVRDDGPGLEFLVSAGTPVHSVGQGRVAFAGSYGSYGRVIILDHGDTFYTVYGGLGTLAVRVGDTVERGTRLADVGAAPRPSVFFEVRRSTRTLDPRSWTGL